MASGLSKGMLFSGGRSADQFLKMEVGFITNVYRALHGVHYMTAGLWSLIMPVNTVQF